MNKKSATHILKSIVYFEDVDLPDWAVMLRDPDLKWSSVKDRLINKVRAFTLERV